MADESMADESTVDATSRGRERGILLMVDPVIVVALGALALVAVFVQAKLDRAELDGAAIGRLGERFSMAAAFAIMASALLVTVLRWILSVSPRAGAAAAAHAMVAAYAIFFEASHLVDRSWIEAVQEGQGRGEGEVIVIWLTLSAVVVGVHVIAAVVPKVRALVAAALRGLGFVAPALALVAAGLALAHTAGGRPSTDAYLDSFTKLGELLPGETKVFAGKSFTYSHKAVWDSPCVELLLPPDRTLESAGCGPETYLLDPQGGFVVVKHGWIKRAFALPSWKEVDLRPSTFASRVSPPIGWTIGSVLTAPLAVLLFAVGMKKRRRATALVGSEGLEGTHLGGGRVQLADGRSAEVPAASSLARGPVMVTGASMQTASYRVAETLTFSAAAAGTREALRLREKDVAASYDGVAAAVACLGLAPLAACWVNGLL